MDLTITNPVVRNNIYRRIETLIEIDMYEKKYDGGLCWYILMATDFQFNSEYNVVNNYPELMKHKPILRFPPFILNLKTGYWFPCTEKGLDKRLEVIKQAIKETENV